jgi:hypothetical protein
MADTYLRERLTEALETKLKAIKRPAYHITAPVLRGPEILPDSPTTPAIYLYATDESKRQDLGAGINNCTLSFAIVVLDVDYTDETTRANELAGDLEKAAGTELAATDADGVTITNPLWVRSVVVVVAEGELLVTVFFDCEYSHRMGDPGRY